MNESDAERMCRRAVANFWEFYQGSGCPPPDAVRMLTKLACHDDGEVAKHGISALFGEIVEPLNDAFREHYCEAYDRTFTEVIQCARRYSACESLDRVLERRGLARARDIFRRKQQIVEEPAELSPSDREAVRKVIVLSRVTIGADIAVTTVAIDMVDRLFPRARVVFVAPASNHYITAGHENVSRRSVSYRRRGDLADRLNAWLDVREVVREEISNLSSEEYVILDTDSRLTQLGLLPLGEDDRYFFFPSRRYGQDERRPLGDLTARWIREQLGSEIRARPHIWLQKEDREWMSVLGEHVRDSSGRPIASISFGVGGDDRKRIGERFEAALLREMVDSGFRVLMTRGVGEEEVARSYRVAEAAERSGVDVRHLDQGRTVEGLRAGDWDVVTWKADLGAFFAGIASSDLYLGYDSAGQHAAAALGVPTITVFCAACGPRHMHRWTPCGSAPVERVGVDPEEADPQGLLDRTLEKVENVRRATEGSSSARVPGQGLPLEETG